MRIEQAIEYADQLLYDQTGRHLNDLQSYIIQQSWQGRTYGQVAILAGYSEGHVKDVASQLWRLLSNALGERITKGNLRSRLINRIKRTLKKASAASFSHPQTAFGLDFVGREQSLVQLNSLCQQQSIVLIQGEGGIGKTTLARRYCQQFGRVLELLIAKETGHISPVESVVEEWLRQYFNQPSSKDFGISLGRLKAQLEQRRNSVVLIDNLESALDGNGQFVLAHRRYVELLRVLSTTKTKTIVTSRDRLCEPSLKVHHYRLSYLSLSAWERFYSARLRQTQFGERGLLTTVLKDMHNAYGGNAKAMEIVCMAAIEEFAGDLSAYWQAHKTNLLGSADLKNLIANQIDRLRDLDAEAYKVFCRLGCDRPSTQTFDPQPLTAEAIQALMWDIPLERQRRTLNSLCDHSILRRQKGHYQLSPAARAGATARSSQHDQVFKNSSLR